MAGERPILIVDDDRSLREELAAQLRVDGEFTADEAASLSEAGTKLRRHESFLLNWEIPIEQGGGRMSLWISREIPLAFVFNGSRPPALNERWMEALLQTSQRTGGMVIMPESSVEGGAEPSR